MKKSMTLKSRDASNLTFSKTHRKKELLLLSIIKLHWKSGDCDFLWCPLTETYCRIHPVVFMGNPNSQEVKRLVASYEEELEAVW